MADLAPPPTFAEVVLVDEKTKKARFNPIWLKWFVDVAAVINAGGGTTLTHNDLSGLQGGVAAERYHMLQAEDTSLAAIEALVTGLIAKTGTGTYAVRTITGTANQIVVADGGGVAAAPGLSLAIGSLLTNVYTPTLSNVANLDASTTYQAQYLRAGAFVIVSGKADVDPTAAVATQLGISLPVASNIGAQEDCCGVAFSATIAGQGAAIVGDAANNRAEMQWIAVDLTNQPMYYIFAYRII